MKQSSTFNQTHNHSSLFSSFGADHSHSHSPSSGSNLTFRPNYFSIPKDPSDTKTTILFGLSSLSSKSTPSSSSSSSDSSTSIPSYHDPTSISITLIGGSFLLKPPPPRLLLPILNALRVATWIRLAMILEQALLSDMGIKLEFPIPPPPSLSLAGVGGSSFRRIRTMKERLESPGAIAGSGSGSVLEPRPSLRKQLWSFVAHRTDRFIQRYLQPEESDSDSNTATSSNVNTSTPNTPLISPEVRINGEGEEESKKKRMDYFPRSTSLDLRSLSFSSNRSVNAESGPRSLESHSINGTGAGTGAGNTLKRSNSGHSLPAPPTPSKDDMSLKGNQKDLSPPFQSTLNTLTQSLHLLTTSPSVRFPPPLLLEQLASKEKESVSSTSSYTYSKTLYPQSSSNQHHTKDSETRIKKTSRR